MPIHQRYTFNILHHTLYTMNTLSRILCVAVLCAAFTPLTSAQDLDCSRIPLSAGAVDHGYDACAQPSDAPALRTQAEAQSFAYDDDRSAFVTFSDAVPQVYNLVAPYNSVGFVNAGDFRGNDLSVWFGLDAGGRAFAANTNTGDVTELGRIHPPDGQTWTALTYDYQDNAFYALASECGSQTSLFTVDFDTRTAARVGPPDTFQFVCGIALASDPADGTLYAYGLAWNQLVTLNKNTGAVSVIGDLNFDPNFGQEMDFDNVDGTLYAYAFNNDTMRGELRTVNTANGRTRFIGVLGGAVPGGSNQVGAGSSQTELNALSITARTSTPTVEQGGTARFSYQVCNGTGHTITGQVFYQASLNGNTVSDQVRVASGMVRAMTCSDNLSFSAEVPSGAVPGDYTVAVVADPDGQGTTTRTNVSVTVIPANEATSRVADWTVTDATPWTFEDGTTVSAAATAAPEVGAYPNPFARQTNLTFSLDKAADVRLAVYDVLGREVAVLVDGQMEAGQHTAQFEAQGLASGTYVYRLVAGQTVQSGRITLMQ